MTGGRHRSDSGFTLVEVLITVVITGFIVGAMTGAIIIGFRSTSSSDKRLAQNRDVELVQGILPQDVMTSSVVTPNAAATTTCSGKQSVLELTWRTPSLVTPSTRVGPPVTSAQDFEVNYVYSVPPPGTDYPPPGATLERLIYPVICTGPSTPPISPLSRRVVASSLSRTSPPTATVSGKDVTLTLTDGSGNTFLVRAKGRS
ncbi:MAG: type II secretion system protein J [Actinomycetota bacterium]